MASWQGDVVYGVCVWRALSLCSAGLLLLLFACLLLAHAPATAGPAKKRIKNCGVYKYIQKNALG